MRGLLTALLAFTSLAAGAEGQLYWEPGLERYAAGPLSFRGAPSETAPPENATTVALIDSGVSRGHPQLARFVVDAVDFTGEGPADLLGHGTALALIAVFEEGGARTRVLSAKVARRDGTARAEDVMSAIDWAVSRGAGAVHIGVGFLGTRGQYRAMCEKIAHHWTVVFFAQVGTFVPPREQYPANCRVGNLYPVWADPAQPRRFDLLFD